MGSDGANAYSRIVVPVLARAPWMVRPKPQPRPSLRPLSFPSSCCGALVCHMRRTPKWGALSLSLFLSFSPASAETDPGAKDANTQKAKRRPSPLLGSSSSRRSVFPFCTPLATRLGSRFFFVIRDLERVCVCVRSVFAGGADVCGRCAAQLRPGATPRHSEFARASGARQRNRSRARHRRVADRRGRHPLPRASTLRTSREPLPLLLLLLLLLLVAIVVFRPRARLPSDEPDL